MTTTSVSPSGDRQVALLDRLGDRRPEPGPGEHRLGEHRGADHGAEVDADEGDDGEHRVAQPVAGDDRRAPGGPSRERCACSRRAAPRASTRGSCAPRARWTREASVMAGRIR